jgi:hypothetical protein
VEGKRYNRPTLLKPLSYRHQGLSAWPYHMSRKALSREIMNS